MQSKEALLASPLFNPLVFGPNICFAIPWERLLLWLSTCTILSPILITLEFFCQPHLLFSPLLDLYTIPKWNEWKEE